MDRQKLVDQIAAIDRLISELRDSVRPVEREIALGHIDRVPDQERLNCVEQREQVRTLVEHKCALRKRITEI